MHIIKLVLLCYQNQTLESKERRERGRGRREEGRREGKKEGRKGARKEEAPEAEGGREKERMKLHE